MIEFKAFFAEQMSLDEKAPPGKKAEEFIKANKEKFKEQYGDD